tara:strand:+ start:472 stop:990 length:519 start_codon:yes stop_codon:yes gene_type:complete
MGGTQQKLLAIFGILLVGGVMLLTEEPSIEDHEPTTTLAFDTNNVDYIHIDSSEGQLRATRSQDGIWTIEAPFAALGSQVRFEEMINELNSLMTMEPFTTTDYEQFGLMPPRTSVLVSQHGLPPVMVQFGDSTPVGDNRYLRIDDGPVFVALGGINQSIERPFATYPADVAD